MMPAITESGRASSPVSASNNQCEKDESKRATNYDASNDTDAVLLLS